MALTDKLTAIANAIRAKTGQSGTLTLPQMATAIANISVGAPTEIYTYEQVNTVAKDYLANANYSASDYSVSVIDTYAGESTDYNKSRPFGKTITLSDSGILYLMDFQSGGVLQKTVSAGSFTVYNLAPTIGGAFVLVKNGEVIQSGVFVPTGTLRMIKADDMVNVRDLGGWACDGGAVAYGKLFRGTEMTGGGLPAEAKITNDGIAVLRDMLHIDFECDLRNDTEARNAVSSALGGSVEYRRYFAQFYQYGIALNSEYATAWRDALLYVMNGVIGGKHGFFHCTYGKDRTGTMACILLALLGVAQADIDKEYELTYLAKISATYTFEVHRSSDLWKGLINYLNTFSGSSFRDKVVDWALQLGIPLQTINDFRTAMINGTPTALSPSVSSFTVTNTLSNATSDNAAQSATQYQPYTAHITPDSGKVITGVTVTMGGTDITGQVFSGNETVFRYGVTYDLTNCALTVEPGRRAVIGGECFCCEITPDTGYTLEGATVTITMGGNNVSTYYKDGVIQIPHVTGNVSITVTAASSAPPYTNLANITAADTGKRISSSGSISTTSASNMCVSNFIPCKSGDILRVKNWDFTEITDSTCYVYGYTGIDGTALYGAAVQSNATSDASGTNNSYNAITKRSDGVIEYKVALSNHRSSGASENTNGMPNTCNYIRISGKTPSSLNDVIITVNEDIT